VRHIRKDAWFLALLSAALQIAIFPLPNLYFLSWIAITPLLIALLRTRDAGELQLNEGAKLLPANPLQAFFLSYVCGIFWYAGTCYWIYSTMQQFGGMSVPMAVLVMLLFSLYLGLYHGAFGLLISLAARKSLSDRFALVLAPFLWVAVELARTRITGFPWDLLGITQVDNFPLVRVARVAGVYGVSFEIMIVNVAFAAAFLLKREKQKQMLAAAGVAALILQSGIWVPVPKEEADHSAVLVQQNIPIIPEPWTADYLTGTLRDLTWISVQPPGGLQHKPSLVVWPESPAPFFTTSSTVRNAIGSVAQQTNAWVVAGTLGQREASNPQDMNSDTYNSGSLFNPSGQLVTRYDKVHLVPFGEYVPFRKIFGFASGLTEQVGDFSRGTSRAPLQAGDESLGVFICYESIFPDEVRQFAANGAQVFVNISNDGWYGDSGAWAQHLRQARMRAIENARWLLRDTNTGVTASIDPEGRIVARVDRKIRTALQAPYALTNVTTFYTRHGDWFAYLCAIISTVVLIARLLQKQASNAGNTR
jgi:apolipoprotein N-acyltransferase